MDTGFHSFRCIARSGISSAKSLQSCPTPCDPMDCSPPGSSVHGILQTRILEWEAIPSSRGSSQPRDQPSRLLHWQVGSLTLAPPGKPRIASSFNNSGSDSKESACNAGELGSIPGLKRSPVEGNGYLLQYSGLENSMDWSP